MGRVRPRALLRLASALLLAAVTACAFTDIFKQSGPGDVVFVWVGDTLVTVGVASPFRIELRVDGVAVSTPSVRVVIPDTTNLDFASTTDSLIGKRPGFADIVATVSTSLSPQVDSTFRIRSRP